MVVCQWRAIAPGLVARISTFVLRALTVSTSKPRRSGVRFPSWAPFEAVIARRAPREQYRRLPSWRQLTETPFHLCDRGRVHEQQG